VAPEARGAGAGRALLEACLPAAADWQVTDVALAVTVGNDAARHLYASAGFVSYGVEPRSLRVEDRFHDVEWMNLRLR
jgi:L-amino acid N-acyltransferase YncA